MIYLRIYPADVQAYTHCSVIFHSHIAITCFDVLSTEQFGKSRFLRRSAATRQDTDNSRKDEVMDTRASERKGGEDEVMDTRASERKGGHLVSACPPRCTSV